jgi:mono/diheme cytochrome c family protein
MFSMRTLLAIFLGTIVVAEVRSEEPTAAQRGEKALLTRVFVPGAWTADAYDNAWKNWDPKLDKAPDDYAAAFRDRYGLHPAPFDNGRYPMGLREGKNFLGGKGMSNDCMVCHGGSILGKSYVGLGNSSLDIQAMFSELGRASGGSGKLPFTFGRVRGTSEAGAMAVFLLSYRESDLKLRLSPLDLGLRDDLIEDVPAWWLLKKKKTMYHTGTTPARSVRSIMQFMLTPLNSAAVFEKEEATFRDIQAYLLSLSPPKYPFAIEHDLAKKGGAIFGKTCAKCHGTYGTEWTYPNKIVPIDVIGTDRNRFVGFSRKVGEHYNKSWFGHESPEGYPVTEATGYQAPPLDGIWATAPYFHNGSVPTLDHVLNSKTRPRIYTRSFRTDVESFDAVKVGWKVQVLEQPAEADLSPYQRRRIYDTTQSGQGNGGHTFGDHLDDDQRRAVIEYLKTL